MQKIQNLIKALFRTIVATFVLCGILLMSANSYQTILGVNAYSLISQKKWEIDSLMVGDYEIIVPNSVENAYLNFSGGSVSGIPGCNNFFANFSIAGGGKMIIIEGGGLTRKLCDSIEGSQIEAIFIKNFIGKFMVQGNEEYIELVGESGFSIRLLPSITLEP